ncbi:PR domain zinc finger protein 4-like [Ptychodera flava]|uniref:PR domain zinc finger protein 4-like n=1 Tax=Ptychodera flava TaxID=63121 RepID=UPI00396A9AFD
MNESLTTINIDHLTNAVNSVNNVVSSAPPPPPPPPPPPLSQRQHHDRSEVLPSQHQLQTPSLPVTMPVAIPGMAGTVSTIPGSVPLIVPERALLNLSTGDRNFPVSSDGRGFQSLDSSALRHLSNISNITLPFISDRSQTFTMPISSTISVSSDTSTASTNVTTGQPIIVNTSSVPVLQSHHPPVPVTMATQPTNIVDHNASGSLDRHGTSPHQSGQPISINVNSINVNIKMPNGQSQPIQVTRVEEPSNIQHHTNRAVEETSDLQQHANQIVTSTPTTDTATVTTASTDQQEDGRVVILSVSKETETTDEIIVDQIITELWCVDCQTTHPGDCPSHGPLNIIEDTPIESKARMSLPKQLRLNPSKISSHTPGVLGVWTHEPIPSRTMFGPLQGKITKPLDTDNAFHSPMIWDIFRDGKVTYQIDGRDENEANWMIFVKRARTHAEQNLVAHQYGSSIYFTTNQDIKSAEELLVWYNRDYAKLIGVTEKPEESYKCSQCEKQFADLNQLGRHMKYAHPDMSVRKWKCHMCSRAFTSSAKLNVHVLVHMGVKPHKCEHCDKTFTDPSNLRMHASIHTGLKKFKCTVCDKTFRQKAHLTSHMVTHTGEKKLKCQYCDRMFSRHSDVRQHTYMHTKEKQVQCNQCGRIFWRLQHLKKHLLTHTGAREHKCDKCEKAFQTKYHLKRHSEICKGPRETKPRTPRSSMRANGTVVRRYQTTVQMAADSSMEPSSSGEYTMNNPRRTNRVRRPITFDDHETESPATQVQPGQPSGLPGATPVQPQMGVQQHPQVPTSSQSLPQSGQIITNEVCEATGSQEQGSVTSSIEE